ncbi:MAG: type III pantothenate kinase [Flavobacteriales bacterium]|nr:type III pantothenate kinase [Flavobacteriales bacterium]
MNLIIDIGNTTSKVAVFDHQNIIFHDVYEDIEIATLEKITKEFSIKSSILSNVRNNSFELEDYLNKKTNLVEFNSKTKVPIIIAYKTPETLGKDRIALAVAASKVYPQKNTLIIDIGTCITYDFIDKTATYYGGAISPGVTLRAKALNLFTGKLPLVEFENKNKIDFIGNSTENSIKSGIFYGIQFEILKTIEEYQNYSDDLITIVTGGNFQVFDLESKNRIFADKFFLLKGLNEILKFNV